MCDWIGTSKGRGKLEKSLIASDAETVNYMPREAYLVTFHTGDQFQAGTDCKVTLTLFGRRGTSEPVTVAKNESRFERGRIDTVLVNIDEIESLVKIRVTVTENGFRTNWFLDKIEVKRLTKSDKVTTFICNHWLDSKSKKSSTVTLVGEVEGSKLLSKSGYEVSVVTSDVRGAGTDANVSLIIFGEFGDSGELKLKESKTNKNKFEKKQTDVFEFPELEDLGALKKVRIWHDNSVRSPVTFVEH